MSGRTATTRRYTSVRPVRHAGMVHPPIYGNGPRSDRRPRGENESSSEFLERIAGPFWDAVRELVETWANRLPDDAYPGIAARLRSRDDRQYRSAFLELYMHETLLRSGYAVKVEPPLPHSPRRPDFLAVGSNQQHYIECRGAGIANEQTAARDNRLKDVYSALQKIPAPNHYVGVHVQREGPRPLATKRLRLELEQWLAGLDPGATYDYENLPRLTWSTEGWAFVFDALPKRPESQGDPTMPTIGVYERGSAGAVDNAPDIRAALADKAGAYGRLDAPLTVVLGTDMLVSDDWQVINALYGPERLLISSDAGNARAVRQLDGFFGAPPQWASNGLTAVLIVNSLGPMFVARQVPTLWIHPGAKHATAPTLPHVRVVTFSDGQLVEATPTISPIELFGLPTPWPPGDPFP